MPTAPTVFISYSHKDEVWKDRLLTHLRISQKEGLLELWDDRRITAGTEWRSEIEKAIDTADVGILLISADFLVSDFIIGKEIPRMLEQRSKKRNAPLPSDDPFMRLADCVLARADPDPAQGSPSSCLLSGRPS